MESRIDSKSTQLISFTTYQIDRETLRHLIGKKAKVPLDVIFAYRAPFPEFIGQIKVDYQRDLIDVLREINIPIVLCLKKLSDLLEVVSHCPSVGISGSSAS